MKFDIPKSWLIDRAKLEDETTPEFHAWIAEDTIARELDIERSRERYMMLLSTIRIYSKRSEDNVLVFRSLRNDALEERNRLEGFLREYHMQVIEVVEASNSMNFDEISKEISKLRDLAERVQREAQL